MRIKCLAQEHNTITQAKASTLKQKKLLYLSVGVFSTVVLIIIVDTVNEERNIAN